MDPSQVNQVVSGHKCYLYHCILANDFGITVVLFDSVIIFHGEDKWPDGPHCGNGYLVPSEAREVKADGDDVDCVTLQRANMSRKI